MESGGTGVDGDDSSKHTSFDEKMMLSGEKLKTLAKLVQRQEENRIMSVPFKSEIQRSVYLQDSLLACDLVHSLVDEAAQVYQNTKSGNGMVVEMGQHYKDYIEYAVNSAIRTVRNLYLRDDLLKKIRAHADEIVPKIKSVVERSKSIKVDVDDDEQNTNDDQVDQDYIELKIDIHEISLRLAAFKDTQFQYLLTYKHPVSITFSRALKTAGTTFEQLVKTFQKKLVREKGSQYGKAFHELEDLQKIEVYDEIVKISGRGSMLKKVGGIVKDVAGKAVLLISIGLAVWDIVSSEHKFKSGAETAVNIISAIASSFAEDIGEVVGTAIVATTVGTVVAESVAVAIGVTVAAVSAAFIALTAFVTGFAVAIAIGAIGAAIIGAIFKSGGQHAEKFIKVLGPHEKPPPKMKFSTTNLHVFVAPMPDAELLARELAYKGAPHNTTNNRLIEAH